MKPITAQRIVDIMEERYAELEKELKRLGTTSFQENVRVALEQDVLSRMNEIEIVLNRVYIDQGPEALCFWLPEA